MSEKILHINPKRFWILGAGKFGRIAIERITRKFQDAVITVVDKAAIETLDDGLSCLKADGIAWLKENFDQEAPVDVIIPAIPVHVAAEWIKLSLADVYEIRPLDAPNSVMSGLPNPIIGSNGQVFTSHADFVCPDNCPEPETICMHTGQPRPRELYRLLREVDPGGFLPVVIRSYQLLPGVGGLYPADLMKALNTVCKHPNRPIMIGTACRCHGVLDFMRMVPKGAPDQAV